MELATLATEAVIVPAIAAWVGLKIDEKYQISPWGMGVGLALGIVASVRLLRTVVKRIDQDE